MQGQLDTASERNKEASQVKQFTAEVVQVLHVGVHARFR
jgi:hypothetical protein